MSKADVSVPSGMRDILPKQALWREWMFATVRGVFRSHGYQPIETPAIERASTLMGKYGEEGDKLLYLVQSTGNLSDTSKELEWDKALRYDLTVPMARYVVKNRNELVFPFKRYQIQNVWRADRPQKGRYREFYQCDVDVLGSDALSHEVDLTEILFECLTKLKVPEFVIRINHRKILQGLIESVGLGAHFTSVCIAIDKLDKIGSAGVLKEMAERGLDSEASEKLLNLFESLSSFPAESTLQELEKHLSESDTGKRGLEEMQTVLDGISLREEVFAKVQMDLTLARGLDYYTGAIFEVVAPDSGIGSIGGGGRYDNLTGVFGWPGNSGVGVSLGLDRIYDVLHAAGVIDNPEYQPWSAPKILFALFEPEDTARLIPLMQELRSLNFVCEWYEQAGQKMKKQFAYADKKGIDYVIVSGAEEAQQAACQIKNLAKGQQELVPLSQVASWLQAQNL